VGQRCANSLARGQQTLAGVTTMPKLRAPEGKASPESTPEWSAETTCNTCGEYKPCQCSDERNLCRTLVFLAERKVCKACGARVLFVDENARTDTNFICGRCDQRREAMGEQAKRARATSRNRRQLPLPSLVRLHLWGLFSTVNDNGKVVVHAS
jgi:hypothetical protein